MVLCQLCSRSGRLGGLFEDWGCGLVGSMDVTWLGMYATHVGLHFGASTDTCDAVR